MIEEFCSEHLELLKQRGAYPYEDKTVLKRFAEKELSNKECFVSSKKKEGKIGDDGKKLDGHISDEENLTCEKLWDKFCMKNMGDYHD